MSFFCPFNMNKYRVSLFDDYGDMNNGILDIKDKGLRIQFSNGEGWEHASISRRNRMPTYDDMVYVKNLLWSGDVCVMQLHVSVEDHVNCHPYCLHLWRPTEQEIPRPPKILIGPG